MAENTTPETTPWQEYLRRYARKFKHLYCVICKQHPPLFTGGPCEHCDLELGQG